MTEKPGALISPRTRPGAGRALLALFVISFFGRLWPLISIRGSWEDAYYYLELARSISHGRFELLGQFHVKYLPGYPAAIALVHGLGLNALSWFTSGQLVLVLAGSLIPGLCFLMAKDFSASPEAAGAAGILAAFNPYLFAWSGVPFSELIFTFQVLAALVLIPRFPLLAGLVAGWAALTRHEGWLLVFPFLVPAAALIFIKPASGARPRVRRLISLLSGLALMVIIGGLWWALARIKTGVWLFEIYTGESASQAPSVGRAGVSFLLLVFPVAGHLALLPALAGVPVFFRSRAGIAALSFAAAYAALHCWWIYPIERYFMPLVPIVLVMAGCGLDQLARRAERLGSGRARAAIVGFAVIAAGLHFAGFAPSLIREEGNRTRGYVEAAEHLRRMAPDFSDQAVMAYDVFLVGYHDGRHPVIPGALFPGDNWAAALPELYQKQNLRYILWSDLYPDDRQKTKLRDGSPHPLLTVLDISGREQQVEIVFEWLATFPWDDEVNLPGFFRPWRKTMLIRRSAHLYRIRVMPAGRSLE